jgi:hypothetical protein
LQVVVAAHSLASFAFLTSDEFFQLKLQGKWVFQQTVRRVKEAVLDLLKESAVLDRDAEARVRGQAEEIPVPAAVEAVPASAAEGLAARARARSRLDVCYAFSTRNQIV